MAVAVEAVQGLVDRAVGIPKFTESGLEDAILKSRGELIFYRVPHASLTLGLLSQAPHLERIADPDIQRLAGYGWIYRQVPVTKGVHFGLMHTGRGAAVEHDEGRWEENDRLKLHLLDPEDRSAINHFTRGRGIKIITDANIGNIRTGINSTDWILAVGNGTVGAAAAVLAEKEIADTDGNLGVHESHGLLILAEARKWGIDWRAGERQNRQLTTLMGKLQRQVAGSGVAGVVLDHLGWRVKDFWDTDEERLVTRLRAMDLTSDGVKTEVMRTISKTSEDYRDGVASMGGNFDAYVEGVVNNVITNYLGIPA